MKAKRLLSVVLAVTVVLSCVMALAFAPTANAAGEYNEYEKYLEAIKPENNYGLADTVNEGKIIQAWNWSYENIIANLETLAEQGFTTIQVSPPNEIKMPTKGVHVCEPAGEGGAPNGWWMFYQPAGFQLNESEDNALGTKSEFVDMCDKAHELGLKVIVDAVINHMGTDDDHIGVYDNDSVDPMDHITPRAAEFEPELLAAKAFHKPWKDMTYVENLYQAMRQYDSTGKPLRDSKGDFIYGGSATEYDIEESLTQHCTSGLPDLATETQLVQDTIYDYLEELVLAGADGFRFDAAKHIETTHDTYFASDFWEDTLLKLRENYPDKECYAYGEILNKCGDGRPFSEYTELMDVTDSSSYWGIKDAVQNNGNGGNPIPYYPSTNFTKENVIQWNESHDTYIDGGTSALTVQQRNKIWALTAARQTITGVYFARPTDTPSSNNSDGNVRKAEIDRLCQTILIGEANKTSWALPEVAAVNQFDNYFGDAEEYNSNQNGVTMIERGGLGATLVNLNGTTKTIADRKANILANGTYIDAITGNEFEVVNGKLSGTIGSTGIACIYYAEDTEPDFPDPTIITDPYDIDVSNGQFPVVEGYNTVVYSASNSSNWPEAYVYAWNSSSLLNNGNWPGNPMKFALVNGYGQNQFVAYIPVEYDCYIISNGKGNNDPGGEQTVDLTVTSSMGMYMDKKVDGKWTIGTWDPPFYPWTPPTQPTTPGETTVPGETTAPVDRYMIGDADCNDKVNVKDVTTIQKVVAMFDVSVYNEAAANVNGDKKVDVRDATAIQKWVAGMTPDSSIGTYTE